MLSKYNLVLVIIICRDFFSLYSSVEIIANMTFANIQLTLSRMYILYYTRRVEDIGEKCSSAPSATAKEGVSLGGKWWWLEQREKRSPEPGALFLHELLPQSCQWKPSTPLHCCCQWAFTLFQRFRTASTVLPSASLQKQPLSIPLLGISSFMSKFRVFYWVWTSHGVGKGRCCGAELMLQSVSHHFMSCYWNLSWKQK